MTSAPLNTPCPICGQPLSVRISRGRKSGKAFILLICATDGRHFRGFINDKAYVSRLIDTLEGTRVTLPPPTLNLELEG